MEINIPCQDRCSIVNFKQFEGEDELWITLYINYTPPKENIIKRILRAIKNKPLELGIVAGKEDKEKLKSFLNGQARSEI